MASFNMDTLTIECFTNKKTYHKYLAKKDPGSFQKNECFQNDLRENHDALIGMLSEYILNPNSVNHKLRDSFNHLMIELLDVLKEGEDNAGSSSLSQHHPSLAKADPDVLFQKCEDLGKEPTHAIEYWKMQNVFKQ